MGKLPYVLEYSEEYVEREDVDFLEHRDAEADTVANDEGLWADEEEDENRADEEKQDSMVDSDYEPLKMYLK